MASRNLTVGLVFLLQAIFGILGNFSLFYHYLVLRFTGHRTKCTDLIIGHLIVANFLVILFKGVPEIVVALGRRYFPKALECTLIFYVQRVVRGISIGTTCLLGIFQAITISPLNSRWAGLKVKAPKYIGHCTLLCWTLNILINIIYPLCVVGKWMNTTITKRIEYLHCSFAHYDNTTDIMYAALLSSPDIVCFVLMLWASGSMVSILHRHKQRVQHVRRAPVASRFSPESRAPQSVLILVSSFVLFYTLSTTFQVLLVLLSNPSQLMMEVSDMRAVCFPALSPFVLMKFDSRISWLCFARIWNAKSPNLFRHTYIACFFRTFSS